MDVPPRPKATMRLLLIRHGETADTLARTLGSRPPGPPPSPPAREQAAAPAPALAHEPIVAVHSSRLRRAGETAVIGADSLDLPHREVDGAHEIDAGDLEGLPYAEALPRYAGTMQQWWTDPEARIPGGESGTEFTARFHAAVDRVVASTPADAPAVLVSHEAAICVWAADTARNRDAEFSRAHGLRNTGSVFLEGSTEGGWTAVSWDGEPLAH
ncbi:histidine phosphatase family protein [Frigoribacterium sp. RIT-PI-h]|uniref:histidine phosphatase family protein n=1 Tax=Frigoribacterium sp. RIT-PI-h TaxID=1690245 RepID=UPI0006B9A0F3|nr:histidine phosphatase family protein [Frigoribacterium sp. RIT-PI-h]